MLNFFFFKQKTAYEMRISDWSSDVCSSDLELMRSIRVIARRALLPGRQRGPLGLLDPATAAGDRMRLPIEFFGAAAPTGNEYRAPQNQCGLGIVGIEARPCPSRKPSARQLPTKCAGGFTDTLMKRQA